MALARSRQGLGDQVFPPRIARKSAKQGCILKKRSICATWPPTLHRQVMLHAQRTVRRIDEGVKRHPVFSIFCNRQQAAPQRFEQRAGQIYSNRKCRRTLPPLLRGRQRVDLFPERGDLRACHRSNGRKPSTIRAISGSGLVSAMARLKSQERSA